MLKMQKQVQHDEALLFDDIVKRGLITNFGIAADIGAHVGSWAVRMAEKFENVLAFEPEKEAYDALVENTAEIGNVKPLRAAVTDKVGLAEVYAPKNSRGKTRRALTSRQVRESKTPNVESITVDSLVLPGCGFMKIDVEGCEPLVLDGAAATIEAFKPILCVEIGGLSKRFGYSEHALVKKVRKMGYELIFASGVDHVFVPKADA